MIEKLYKVENRCKHDIGVKRSNNMDLNIAAGSFAMLPDYEIQFIEASCAQKKFFASRMLVVIGDDRKEMDPEKLWENVGIVLDESEPQHMTDEEIIAMLKKPAKQIEAWLEHIEDPAELHTIYLAGKQMDLPKSKLALLAAKMPEKEWLG